MEPESPDLQALRRRLEEEEAAYGSFLDPLDRLATFPLPAETLTDLPAQREKLNQLWSGPAPDFGRSLSGTVGRHVWESLRPVFDRQQEFNAVLVQALNGYLDENARLQAHL